MLVRLFALTVTLALLLGCATSPTGRSQLVLMPDNEINQLGLQAFTSIKKETRVERSTVTNRYVRNNFV